MYIHVHTHILLPLFHLLLLLLQVLLFDVGSTYWRLEAWRKEFWEAARIGIPADDKESRDAIVFGFLTYWFISQVSGLVVT